MARQDLPGGDAEVGDRHDDDRAAQRYTGQHGNRGNGQGHEHHRREQQLRFLVRLRPARDEQQAAGQEHRGRRVQEEQQQAGADRDDQLQARRCGDHVELHPQDDVRDVEDAGGEGDGQDREVLRGHDLDPAGGRGQQGFQRAAFLLAGQRVRGHDRAAGEHHHHDDRGQDASEEESGGLVLAGGLDPLER